MAVSTDKIALGVCDATFGSTDLGATKGGVEVSITTETYAVKADQTGESTLKEIITGTMVEVKVPMLETDLGRLLKIMPQAVGIGTAGSEVGVEIRTGVNVDLSEHTAELLLHPTGLAGSDKSKDFTVFKAAPSPTFTFKYATGEERVYEVTFKGYPDTAANGKIAAFGAPVAA
ncbi:hypothetical protein [Niveispirillum sp. KHB5.9]|uniref:hypothetical protein n=1 Tax=Niveispirillum sp. KHB5.9 TaxID=3400269 RepID=UPI003A89310A